jgi:hypothetical protein
VEEAINEYIILWQMAALRVNGLLRVVGMLVDDDDGNIVIEILPKF